MTGSSSCAWARITAASKKSQSIIQTSARAAIILSRREEPLSEVSLITYSLAELKL
jgi:hypothetical protein